MNAVADNSFTRSLFDLAKKIPQPKAVLVVSAHWQTPGTQILKADPPKTIYDFYGFPEELYRVQYRPRGAPEVSDRLQKLLSGAQTTGDWGLDHGAWSVLMHMYPDAQIPALQLSLNRGLTLAQHFEFARELRPLRDEGLLILGSGNITHNLRALLPDPEAAPVDWAIEFDEMMKKALLHRDTDILLGKDPAKHALWRQNHPTTEHYIPLLYAVGASYEHEVPEFPHMSFHHGSLSMRSVRYGA